MRSSTVTNNTATSDGGGLLLASSVADVSYSTVSGNVGYGEGGGAAVIETQFTVGYSTFSGNSAGVRGGAIHAREASSLVLANSTVWGNTAGRYAAVYLAVGMSGTASISNALIRSVTIANNTNDSGARSAGLEASNSTATLHNSILSGNKGGEFDCKTLGGGTVRDDDGNLVEIDDNCGNFAIEGTSPMLDILSDNGGETLTVGLLEGSPAINTGNNGACLIKDQRGELRDDGKCDIDAYEGFISSTCVVIKTQTDEVISFCL